MCLKHLLRFFFGGILIGILLILNGCTKMESLKSKLIPSKPEESYIQATRKSELVFDEITRIVLIAVHLNSYDEKNYPHENGEVFFVDVYQSEQNSLGFLENGYRLTLSNGPDKNYPTAKQRFTGVNEAKCYALGGILFG